MIYVVRARVRGHVDDGVDGTSTKRGRRFRQPPLSPNYDPNRTSMTSKMSFFGHVAVIIARVIGLSRVHGFDEANSKKFMQPFAFFDDNTARHTPAVGVGTLARPAVRQFQ